jgi:hypothetical protein
MLEPLSLLLLLLLVLNRTLTLSGFQPSLIQNHPYIVVKGTIEASRCTIRAQLPKEVNNKAIYMIAVLHI